MRCWHEYGVLMRVNDSPNIFKQAKALLLSKSILDMDEEELTTVNAAQIPLNMSEFNDKTTDEGLEELAKMFDGRDKNHGHR